MSKKVPGAKRTWVRHPNGCDDRVRVVGLWHKGVYYHTDKIDSENETFLETEERLTEAGIIGDDCQDEPDPE